MGTKGYATSVRALLLIAALIATTTVAVAQPSRAEGGSLDPISEPQVLVDAATQGYYNAALGTTLDGTQVQFPCANVQCGDPVLPDLPEPDLGAAATILGDWLTADPLPLGSSWTTLQGIPSTWAVNSETAIVYPIDAGDGGLLNVTGQFGVDNGVYVWLDGA